MSVDWSNKSMDGPGSEFAAGYTKCARECEAKLTALHEKLAAIQAENQTLKWAAEQAAGFLMRFASSHAANAGITTTKPRAEPKTSSEASSEINADDLRVLGVLAHRPGVPASNATEWRIRCAVSREGWEACLYRLNFAGLIFIDPAAQTVRATRAGVVATALSPQTHTTPADLRTAWQQTLGVGAGALIQRLAPESDGMTRSDLAKYAGMAPGRSFISALSRLLREKLAYEAGGRVFLNELLRDPTQ